MVSTKDTTQDSQPEEGKAAFMAAPDADKVGNLDQLNRQTGGNALLRATQIFSDKKARRPGLLPVGKTTFYKNLKEGVYPFTQVRLGPKTVAFYYREVMKFIEDAGAKTTTGKGV